MTISFENLTFSYAGSGENVFENLTLQLDTDWKTGLIGRNGRGKTTLLRLLRGDFEGEYSGRIVRPVETDYFPCETGDRDAFTVDLLGELSGAEEWRICKELKLLKVSEDALYRPFSSLSGGEQTKALLAAAFLREGRYLLIDEPTNHVDEAAKAAVAAYLKGKKGFLLVSHDRALLNACTDHIAALRRSGISLRNGNYDAWKENDEREERAAIAGNKKLSAEIGRLKEAARVKSEWSREAERGKFGTQASGLRPDRGYVGHKAAKLMKASKVIEARRERAIGEKEGLLRNVEETGSLKMRPSEFYSERLLEVKRVRALIGGVPVSPPTSFAVCRGERVALVGKNGCGKSSLLKAITGELPFEGELVKPLQLKISYVPQDASALSGSIGEYARARGIDEALFRAALAALGFGRKELTGELSALSAGQKKKAALAGSLCESAHLYIWDEPLNFVDVLSREQIEELIAEFRPSLLFVEHDAEFRRSVATKTIYLDRAEEDPPTE